MIAARDNKQDPFDAITAVIPWDRFLASVAEAGALARSEEFDPYQMLGEHLSGSVGRAKCCAPGALIGATMSSVCCRNCATACAPGTSGWWAAGDIAPSRNA